MRVGFNRKFYRHWPFWVGVVLLVTDGCLRWLAGMLNDPLGLSMGILWVALGIVTPMGHF